MRRLLILRGLFAFLACSIACVLVSSAAPTPKDATKSAAQLRQVLDEIGDATLENQSLVELAEFFKTKLKAEVRYDNATITSMGIDPNTPLFNLKMRKAKYREGLKMALAPMSLTFGIVGSAVYIGPEESVIHAQMRQRVSVNGDATDLATVLKAMGNQSGANLVLDPRIEEKASNAAVKLKLEDVALETAVRLVAEVSGFATVRMGNVLMVTSEDRAEKLRPIADGRMPVTLPIANLPVVAPPISEVPPLGGGLAGQGGLNPNVPEAPKKKD